MHPGLVVFQRAASEPRTEHSTAVAGHDFIVTESQSGLAWE